MRPGNPVRVMLAQRLSDAGEILARLGGQCMAEYKYDGMRLQAHRTADGQIELFTRRQERVSSQFPDVVELLQVGLGPREAILEGEVVAYDAAAGELRPFQEVMFRRRKHGIAEAARDVPVGLFCFELLYADGQDLTGLSYLDRRARLADAVTLSDRLRLTTALEVATAPALDAAFEQAVADGSEGLVCKSTGPTRSIRLVRAAGCGSSSSGITALSWLTPSTSSLSAPTPDEAGGGARTVPCCWPRTTRRRSSIRRSAGAAPGSPTPSWPRCRQDWRR